jgi:hypothetical protein
VHRIVLDEETDAHPYEALLPLVELFDVLIVGVTSVPVGGSVAL